MPSTEKDVLDQHLNKIQEIINRIREKLQNKPLHELQIDLNNLRYLIMNNNDFHPKHKERLLDRIEDVQNIICGSLPIGLQEIQRELHNNFYSKSRNSDLVERIKVTIGEFFE